MNKNQIKTFLKNYQDYGRYLYYTESGVELFNQDKLREANGLKFKISILENGNFQMDYFEKGFKVEVKCLIETAPILIKPSLENVRNGALIMNPEEVPAENLEAVKHNLIFAQSLFQRIVAYAFIARMQSETMDVIATTIESGWQEE